MTWAITYNNFGTSPTAGGADWSAETIGEYRSEPVFAGDGVTWESTRHVLSGSALIRDTTSIAFEAQLVDARTKLSRQGGQLVITGGGTTKLVNKGTAGEITTDESLGTPRCEFSITRITGKLAAIVGFTFTWTDYEIITADSLEFDYHAMSHWWTQTFDIEESGLTVHTIDGVIRIRADAGAAGTSPLLGANPDAYRNLIMPALPGPGFRVDREKWATSDDGQGIAYSIVFREHARALPWPAKRGGGRMSWQRSMDSGDGMLGIKVFEAELEGDQDAKPTDLLAALVRCAQNRIIFAPGTPFGTFGGADQILSIRVDELDLFNRNHIGLEIVAKSTGGAANPFGMTGPGYVLLDNITAGTGDHVPPSTYGDQQIASVRRVLFEPASGYTGTNFPKAQTQTALGAFLAYEVPAYQFDPQNAPLVPAGQQAEEIQPAHLDRPYLRVSVTERVDVIDTGMLVMKSHSLTAADIPYQWRGPTVLITSEATLVRQAKAPPRVFLRKPDGCVLKRESWHVSPGPLDANNNRSFTGYYTRVVEVMRQAQPMMWNPETSGYGDTFLTFKPPNNALVIPHDPIAENPSDAAQRTIFEVQNISVAAHFITTPEKYAT